MRKRNKLKASVGTLAIRIFLSNLALVTSTGVAIGNPIAVVRTFELNAEDVTVTVYRSESRIEGDYTFRNLQQPKHATEGARQGLKPDDRLPNGFRSFESREATDDTVRIMFPVVVPTNGIAFRNWFHDRESRYSQEQVDKLSIRERLDLGMPVGTIDGVYFTLRPTSFAASWRDARWDIEAFPYWLGARRLGETVSEEPELPDGWDLAFFMGYWKGDSSRREVKMHISYTQPHFPGNISAYLAFLPDNVVKTNYLITFQAEEGTRFSPAGSYEIVGRASDTNLSVRPAHLQLLEVQVK